VSLSGARVLVTGAGGFIGSHLVERLVAAGAKTRALVRYKSDGSWGWLDRSPVKDQIDVVRGDICDRDSVLSAVEGTSIVFHLAALIAIPYSYHAPASYIRTNIEGTLNVLQAARNAGVTRVIHTSTSEVYGTAEYVPIDEAHPLQGQSPYSASKIGADKMAEAFHLSFNLPVVTVRPFNTFGPRQSARAVIPTIITQCLTSDVIKLGNLSPTRDFNFVGNTVDAFLLAASSANAVGQVINVGSGIEISIGDIARKIVDLTKKNARIETDDVRFRPDASEVEQLLASNSRARDILGWTPRISFEEGLQQTITWIQTNLNEYKSNVYSI